MKYVCTSKKAYVREGATCSPRPISPFDRYVHGPDDLAERFAQLRRSKTEIQVQYEGADDFEDKVTIHRYSRKYPNVARYLAKNRPR